MTQQTRLSGWKVGRDVVIISRYDVGGGEIDAGNRNNAAHRCGEKRSSYTRLA